MCKLAARYSIIEGLRSTPGAPAAGQPAADGVGLGSAGLAARSVGTPTRTLRVCDLLGGMN